MITHPADYRPSGHAPIQAPQPLVQARMFFADPSQIGRWCENAQSAEIFQREMAIESSIKFARAVIARPNGMVVHLDRHDFAGKAHFRPRPSTPPQVMGNFPGTEPADHREYERTTGLEQARTFARHVSQVWHAIQWAEIGVGTVKDRVSVQALQFMSAHCDCTHTLREVRALRTVAGPLYHPRRPVGRRYLMPEFGHPDGVQPGAAT